MRNFEIVVDGYSYRLRDYILVEKIGLEETAYKHKIEFTGQSGIPGMKMEDLIEVLRLSLTHRNRRQRCDENEEALEHLYQAGKCLQARAERKQKEAIRKEINNKFSLYDPID